MNIKELYEIYLRHPHVTTDSRKVAKGDIYFALRGERFDGNAFASNAISAGAAYAVIDREEYAQDDHYILVDDTLQTLTDLATFHRSQQKLPVVGITGTNGKTTTKELVHSVLSQRYNVLATEGNLNNHIGVPLMVLRITADHDIAVIEMGASAVGEIAHLCKIAQPTLGLITNVGKAHLQGFGSVEGIVRAKSELAEYLYAHGGIFLLNSDDARLYSKWSQRAADHTFGMYGEQAAGISVEGSAMLQVKMEKGTILKTHLVGSYNLNNVLAAVAVGRQLALSDEQIQRGIESYMPKNNRSQLQELPSGTVIISDAYNANPSSMIAAINNLLQMPQDHKVAILGDMLELGAVSDEEHMNVIDKLKQHPDVEVFLCGKEFVRVNNGSYRSFDNVDQLQQFFRESGWKPKQGSVVLIKGSHGIDLEKIDFLSLNF